MGESVRQFLASYKSGTAWYASGLESAGNDALMRIAPMLIPQPGPGPHPGPGQPAVGSSRLGETSWMGTCLPFAMDGNKTVTIAETPAQ